MNQFRTLRHVCRGIVASLLWVVPASAGGTRCLDVELPVQLEPGEGDEYTLRGSLCVPRRNHGLVQVLVHGASYNRNYWDYPFENRHYSYVRRAHGAGFATLALDRIGSGQSDRPDGTTVSVHASAFTVHQVVTALRDGWFEDSSGEALEFEQVVLVGHSFGSNIAWTEAALYGDVDGLVLTGISHDENPPGAILTQTLAYPAELDPLFADLDLPPGYITTLPGARGELFHHLPTTSPELLVADEMLKDTVPVGMLFDQFTTYGYTQSIDVPVLNVVGDYDILACQLPSCSLSGSIDGEGDNYPLAPQFEQWIIPNAAHALNLHENAPSWYARVQRWLRGEVADCRRGRRHP